MKQTSSIEPGLLYNFRLFSGLKLLIVFLVIASRASSHIRWQERITISIPAFYLVIESTIMLLYLFIPWLQYRLRRWYLPIALIFITLSTLLFNYLSLYHEAERSLLYLIASELQLIPLLFIPLIFIAWQYRFRVVVYFCVLTALIQMFMIRIFTDTQQIILAATYGVIVVRTFSFFTVGYLVSQLMNSQRRQRKQLAHANISLSKYSDTIQQLILSQERNRLSRELHDTLAHTLGGIAIQLEAIQTIVDDEDTLVQQKLQQSLDAARSGLKETRRVLKNLRASPLDDLGLKLAIESYAMSVSERASLDVHTKISDDLPRITPEIEQGIFRIVQESLENIIRHARADHVAISLQIARNLLTLHIQDNGQGFDTSRPATESNLGITGMHERAQLLGGNLDVASSPQGTTVTFTLEI